MRHVAGKMGSQEVLKLKEGNQIKIHHLANRGTHFEKNDGNSLEKKN